MWLLLPKSRHSKLIQKKYKTNSRLTSAWWNRCWWTLKKLEGEKTWTIRSSGVGQTTSELLNVRLRLEAPSSQRREERKQTEKQACGWISRFLLLSDATLSEQDAALLARPVACRPRPELSQRCLFFPFYLKSLGYFFFLFRRIYFFFITETAAVNGLNDIITPPPPCLLGISTEAV